MDWHSHEASPTTHAKRVRFASMSPENTDTFGSGRERSRTTTHTTFPNDETASYTDGPSRMGVGTYVMPFLLQLVVVVVTYGGWIYALGVFWMSAPNATTTDDEECDDERTVGLWITGTYAVISLTLFGSASLCECWSVRSLCHGFQLLYIAALICIGIPVAGTLCVRSQCLHTHYLMLGITIHMCILFAFFVGQTYSGTLRRRYAQQTYLIP